MPSFVNPEKCDGCKALDNTPPPVVAHPESPPARDGTSCTGRTARARLARMLD